MLSELKKRREDKKVFREVNRLFKKWYGVTTNISCVVDLPKDIPDVLFEILRKDIDEFLKKKLNYTLVESEEKAKIAVILFEQNDEDLVEGFQVFVRLGNVWLTKVGINQRLEKVEKPRVTSDVEFYAISPEWMERTEKTITDFHIISKHVIIKTADPKKTETLYFA